MFLGTAAGQTAWDYNPTVGSISDGLSTTILLSENHLAGASQGNAYSGNTVTNWATAAPELHHVPRLGQRLRQRRPASALTLGRPGAGRRQDRRGRLGPGQPDGHATRTSTAATARPTRARRPTQQQAQRRRRRRDVRRVGPVHQDRRRRDRLVQAGHPRRAAAPLAVQPDAPRLRRVLSRASTPFAPREFVDLPRKREGCVLMAGTLDRSGPRKSELQRPSARSAPSMLLRRG